MRRSIILTVSMIVVLSSLLAACGGSPTPPPQPATPEPAKATATSTPVATSAPASPATAGTTDGKAVFEKSCSVCHNLDATQKRGPGLAGLFGKSQLLNGKPFNDENLREWITKGYDGMPAKPLPDDQMTALLAFLKDATK